MTETGLFANLDATGRFHRDTAVGGCLHRGLSFREDRPSDAVHVCVDGRRVTVHVDRYSPLNHRPGARLRYSIVGVVSHWMVDIVARAARRRLGRAAIDHCHLDCEVEWVPDDEIEPDRPGAGIERAGPAQRSPEPPGSQPTDRSVAVSA